MPATRTATTAAMVEEIAEDSTVAVAASMEVVVAETAAEVVVAFRGKLRGE